MYHRTYKSRILLKYFCNQCCVICAPYVHHNGAANVSSIASFISFSKKNHFGFEVGLQGQYNFTLILHHDHVCVEVLTAVIMKSSIICMPCNLLEANCCFRGPEVGFQWTIYTTETTTVSYLGTCCNMSEPKVLIHGVYVAEIQASAKAQFE